MPPPDLTVGFADLANSSGLSTSLDVNRIGYLVEVFEARCADVVAAHGGRMIKTIGDAVLFVAEGEDGAGRAARIAFGLVEVIGRDARLPDVRLGLASGPVVTRLGDVFGSPVNLAARLTALARRNRVLIDDATSERLPVGGTPRAASPPATSGASGWSSRWRSGPGETAGHEDLRSV